MRVLITVNAKIENGWADPVAAAASFPWPAESVFSVLTVADVVPPPPMIEVVPNATDVSDIQRNADNAAQTIATSAAADLQNRGFDAEGIGKEGDPSSVIVDHAKEWGADLIVIGSCEKSRVEKFFLGSVSESVVKHAPCSVLLVKGATHGIP